MNNKNLISLANRQDQELREIARKGGIKSGQVRREKKLMSQIYSDFLVKQNNIKKKGKSLNDIIQIIIERGDSASVSLLKEIREATEGNKITNKFEQSLEQDEAVKEIMIKFGIKPE